MNVQSLLIRLQAWAQEELAAQERLGELLKSQEGAIVENARARLQEIGGQIEAELAATQGRERRRRELIGALAAVWKLPEAGMTLRVAVERGWGEGCDMAHLEQLRATLRERTAATLKRGRKVAALARYHQGVVRDVLEILVGNSAGGAAHARSLVDAEA